METELKLKLINRNLQEIIGKEELYKKIKSNKPVSVYWGTAITSSISIAYFFPMLKISDLLKAGCKVKILFADLHGALDGTSWEMLEKRYKYYKETITSILKIIEAPTNNLEFVKGSDFQLDKKYFEDLLKLSTNTTIHDAKKAASEVVKLGDNPRLSGIIYPLMQALDEEYLKVDAQLGGSDQRKIMVFARENLPKIGYKERIEVLNPLIPGLVGEKMSSSNEASKIDLMDNEETVKKKINSAECVAGNPNNGLMALLEYFIFVIKSDKKEKYTINRQEKYGGNLLYSTYEELENDFINKKLHPLDLKISIANEINTILKTIRKNSKLKKLHKEAYA
ncbi:MAG: tyrosine--tRNA ligase [archaeon]